MRFALIFAIGISYVDADGTKNITNDVAVDVSLRDSSNTDPSNTDSSNTDSSNTDSSNTDSSTSITNGHSDSSTTRTASISDGNPTPLQPLTLAVIVMGIGVIFSVLICLGAMYCKKPTSKRPLPEEKPKKKTLPKIKEAEQLITPPSFHATCIVPGRAGVQPTFRDSPHALPSDCATTKQGSRDMHKSPHAGKQSCRDGHKSPRHQSGRDGHKSPRHQSGRDMHKSPRHQSGRDMHKSPRAGHQSCRDGHHTPHVGKQSCRDANDRTGTKVMLTGVRIRSKR